MKLVVEHKTTAADISPGADYWARLRLDQQVSIYLYATGAEACVYDVLRVPALRPGKNETHESFFIRCADDIAARPSHYLARAEIPRPEAAANAAAIDRWLIARAIGDAKRLNRYPKNPDNCLSYGSRCPYLGLCLGELSSDDERFVRLDTEHVELEKTTSLPMLTASSIRTWLACPKKYEYSYVQRIRPRESARPLRFGALVHKGLEVWWRSVDAGGAIEEMRSARTPETDDFELAKAEAMLIAYHLRWKDEEYTVLAVEQEFAVPLINPATGAKSKSWVLGGKVDAVAERSVG